MTRGTRLRTPTLLGTLALGVALAAATAPAPAASEPQVSAGNLGFRLTLRQSGPFTLPCPGGVPDIAAPLTTACVPFAGGGSVRGLGNVSVTYTELLELGPPACPADLAKQLAATGRVSVAGKGEIVFAFAEGAQCVADWQSDSQEFAITGGTGAFAAASGRGKRVQAKTVPGRPGADTWTGTLEVRGHAFDVTAPKLRGAGSKTVRAQNGARSARVTFKVTATDGVDGAVPVSCKPKSGSRFKLGRTTVRCEAVDSSGNASKAAFMVAVK